jgi:hypothetical protein
MSRTIKPAEGRRVRRPDRQLLAAEGESVTWGSYWQRLLNDGDVVEVEPSPAAGAAPIAAPAAVKKDA